MTTEPTDEELAKLFTEETGFDVDDFPAAILDFARAARQRWGQPSGAGEVVYQASYKDGFWQDCSRERYEYLKALKIGSSVDWTLRILYTTPQPTQAVPPAGWEPLTDAQAQELIELESWGPDAIGLNAQLLRTIRRTEAAHGINAKEAGNADQ